MNLDLSELTLDGVEREVDIELGMGDVRVDVPSDAHVVVNGEIGAGQLEVFGSDDAGFGVTVRETREGSSGSLVLNLDVGAGHGSVA